MAKRGESFRAIDALGYLSRFDKNGKPTDKRRIATVEGAIAAHFMPNGDLFFIKENAAIVLSLAEKKEPSKRILGVNPIIYAAFADDLFAAIDSDGILQIFSIGDLGFYSLCPAFIRRPSALFFSADKRYVLAAEREGATIVFDLMLNRISLEIKTPKPIIGGAFLALGRLLLFCRDGDQLVVSRYAEGAPIDSISSPRASAVIVAARHALAGLESGTLAAIDITHNRISGSWKILSEPIAALFRRGENVFVVGEKGAAASFDLAELNKSCAIAIASEDYEASNALLSTSGFCLLNDQFCDWLERAWEESVYPSALRVLVEGKQALAREAVSPFWDDLPKRARFEEASLLSSELSELREAFKNRRMRETQALLSAYPILNESLTGKLYFDEWQNAVEGAIEDIREGEKEKAQKALSPFQDALEKGETARRIIDFPAPFLRAMERAKEQDWQGFAETCEREPICKGLPRFEARERKIAALEREMVFWADQHAYELALNAAKNLSALGAPPILKDPIAALLAFVEAIQKGKNKSALVLASKYSFLTDAPQFLIIFKECAARMERAWKAASVGDSQAVYLRTLDEAANPLYLDYAALLMRVAFTEEMRRVTVSGAINWEETLKNYERYFGRDPLLRLAFEAQEKTDLLRKSRGERSIRGYEHFDLPQTVLSFVDLGGNEPSRAFSKLTRISLIAALLIASAFAVWIVAAGLN
jgi:hypothetical protein